MSETIVVEGPQGSGYRFSWGLAIAGGAVSFAVAFFLLTLGSGFGLMLVHPGTSTSLPTFLTGGAIYFLAAQAFGFACGGHLVGRLLGPLVESRVQEEFRAAAHGLVAWAVTVAATLAVVALGAMSLAAGGPATLYAASAARDAQAEPTAYLVDTLVRPAAGSERGRAEASRILDIDIVRGEQLDPEDRARLIEIVSSDAGIARDRAAVRVDAMQSALQARTRAAADLARRTASHASLWLALSLFFGAVISMFAAVLAREEDDREALLA